MVYAQIVTEISLKNLDRIFTYGVPQELVKQVKIGTIVEIPFGAGNRPIKGYVVDLTDRIDFDVSKLKQILRIYEDVSYEQELIELAAWMKRRYHCTMPTALKTLLPTQPDVGKKIDIFVQSTLDEHGLLSLMELLDGNKRSEARIRVLEVLIRRPFIKRSVLIEHASVSSSVIKTMIKDGLLKTSYEDQFRLPYDVEDYDNLEHLEANPEQRVAIDAIQHSFEQQLSDVYLLHGITGSGKTEVYLQVVAKVLEQGASAIVLIPEIGLTPLMVKRFVQRFGDVIGIMHSRLSDGERFDQWRMAKEGRLKVMIGPRSAIFTPFENIGVIIIDEEHEMTYKSDMPPKYNAREVAIYRGHQQKCPVVLGSATPLVETYYKAKEGAYQLLTIGQRAQAKEDTKVMTVDMRQELAKGNLTMFSKPLYEAIVETLEKKEQIILFLNQRGYAKFVACRVCGYVVKCDHCDVPYHYHKFKDQLLCHYCNKHIAMVDACPNCGSGHIREFGVGTQKVQDMLAKTFKQAKVLRMDYDSTTGKHGHEKVLSAFERHEADILLGTQMVAKGHHFDNVTLVGVLAADMSLFANDFRASERTFQLLTQVIGRSGRSYKPGRAIIQTYSPDHYSIQCAYHQDYERFYNEEIKYRKLMGYPPYKHMMVMLFTSKDERYIIRLSNNMKQRLQKYEVPGKLELLGPAPATLSKLNDVFRQLIYVKSEGYGALIQLIEVVYIEMKEEDTQNKGSVVMDINPMMSY